MPSENSSSLEGDIDGCISRQLVWVGSRLNSLSSGDGLCNSMLVFRTLFDKATSIEKKGDMTWRQNRSSALPSTTRDHYHTFQLSPARHGGRKIRVISRRAHGGRAVCSRGDSSVIVAELGTSPLKPTTGLNGAPRGSRRFRYEPQEPSCGPPVLNGWDSVQRFYTPTCEVRVNKITGTIVSVISKIKR